MMCQRGKVKIHFCLAIAAVYWMWTGAIREVSAATYFVAANGSDSNSGTMQQPFATFNRAAGLLQPGDALYARGGTYYQTVYVAASGSSASPITISAYNGENVVIDGAYANPASAWGTLFRVDGSYVVVQNLTIRNSNWIGLGMNGPYAQVLGVNSQSNMENGIIISGSASNSLVQGCNVQYNAKSNEAFQQSRGGWASGLSAARGANYVTLRNNRVWNNWGEGLSTYEAVHTLMTGNVVYDNQLNVYISDTKFTTCSGNLIYSTPGNVCSNISQIGIGIGDEKYNPPSSDNTIVNNLLLHNSKSIYFWSGVNGGGLVNVVIAYNTAVDSVVETNLKLLPGTHTNSFIGDNIFVQEDALPVAVVYTPQGITFSHNLWSKTPPSVASGPGDVIASPSLQKTGNTGPGQLTPDWFRIPFTSPAVEAAFPMATVTVDFSGVARPSLADMGALEHILAPPTHLEIISTR